MTIKADRSRIRDVDETGRTITFEPGRHGKITGSRFYAVLGKDPYVSEFEAACNIARIYSEYEPTKYTLAGEAIEPVIRSYVRNNSMDLLRDPLDISDIDRIGIEEPVSKFDCGFDHFPRDSVFGGMVDGYVKINGRRAAILEIKTAGDRSKWVDEDGNMTKVPENYVLQASLYAELSGLKKIVFAVGFLEEKDYENPKAWRPSADNCFVIAIDKIDMTDCMDKAGKWFEEHIIKGVTPAWTDRDEKIVDYLTVRRVDFVAADLTETIRKYAENRSKLDVLRKQTDECNAVDAELCEKIRKALVDRMSEKDTKMEYEQNGFVFRISADAETMADDTSDKHPKTERKLKMDVSRVGEK